MPKRTYKYVIELDEAMWPRNIADYMLMQSWWVKHLLSVQDMQRADHMYAENNTKESDTFTIQHDGGEQ